MRAEWNLLIRSFICSFIQQNLCWLGAAEKKEGGAGLGQLTLSLWSLQAQQQAMEVWQGLALLSEAILQGQALLANSSQPSEALQLHVDKAVSGLRSLTSLLRALGAQVCRTLPHTCVALSGKWEEGPAKEMPGLSLSPL